MRRRGGDLARMASSVVFPAPVPPTSAHAPRAEPRPLRPVEIVAGQVFGEERSDPLPVASASPRAALELILAEALSRPPCLVAFSGGRDSSGLLALAMHVARREGLELPVPITHRFPHAPETDESEWQGMIVEHLGISDWATIEHGSELDIVGPIATRALTRHGLLYPANAHTFIPLLEMARGGTLLTGLDGDLILGGWRWHDLADVRTGHTRLRGPRLRRIAHAYAPPRARLAVAMRREVWPPMPWLTPAGRRKITKLFARDYAHHPRRFDRFLSRAMRLRLVLLQRRQIERLADAAGATVIHPYSHPPFVSALREAGGRNGVGDRTSAMRQLLGDLLPDAVLRRESKARFDAAYWADYSRDFAAQWNGEGLDTTLVRPDALRENWSRPTGSAQTAIMLQSLWLRSRSGHATPQ